MELRDYLRMLRRGWPVVVVLTLLALGAAGAYLAVAPKSYTSTSSVVLVANNPQTIGDAQQGVQLAQSFAPTVADIIDSPAVLSAVSSQLDPAVSTDALVAMVKSVARTGTSIIDITVTGPNPRVAAQIANLAATGASSAVAGAERADGSTGIVTLRVDQIVGAAVATTPTSPDAKGVLLIGLIIGLALGIAVAVLRHALDTRIHYAEDLRRSYDPPILSIIPRTRGAARGRGSRGVALGPGGEGFRTLRTNLGYLESSDRSCFALASAGADRGGASTAINLAISFAQAGRRTLLVDCDLRRDTVGDALGINHGVGLADLLGGFAELEAVTRLTDHESLSVILAGTPQRNPSDLLSSVTMTALLQHVEDDYDDVILHAPSLQDVSDAAIVARAAACTIITVEAGRTTIRQVDDALGALERVHVVPVGFVLVGTRGRIPAARVPQAEPLSLEQFPLSRRRA